MGNFFKSQETNKLLHSWITEYPDNFCQHGYDTFDDFVFSLLENDEVLTVEILTEIIKAETSWELNDFTNEFIKGYVEKFNTIRHFWIRYKTTR
jgi:hypothetical protein